MAKVTPGALKYAEIAANGVWEYALAHYNDGLGWFEVMEAMTVEELALHLCEQGIWSVNSGIKYMRRQLKARMAANDFVLV